MLDNKISDLENKRLDDSKNKLKEKIQSSQNSFSEYYKNVQEQSIYLSESYNEMDNEEKVQVKNSIMNYERKMQDEQGKQKFYEKAIKSPFFGSVDWVENGESLADSFYVGITGIENAKGKAPFVCDWRAPISSLFYDFERGKAHFDPPQGRIEGEIILKRQYKIEDGEFLFGIDVNETIADEILKEALAQSSAGSMKTIVSTIQKEQNEIIRRNPNSSLLIQGIAGSGKTSIALHRIAYLLYRQKESLVADNVLVISPSLIFSKFIGNVLPELGEENIGQLTFESISREFLKKIARVEPREEMLSNLLCASNIQRKEEIDKKSSFEFLDMMISKLSSIFRKGFEPKDIVLGETTIRKEKLVELWENNYDEKTVATKIDWITDYIVEEIEPQLRSKKSIYDRIKKVLLSYVSLNKPLEILSSIYNDLGFTLKLKNKNEIFYEDTAPLMLVCDYLYGLKKDPSIKCLVVDEMQDHTPIVFYLLKKMYSCPLIVLGDINQSIEHSYSKEYLAFLTKFIDAEFVELNTSYRSTVEISEFAQNLIGIKNAKNFNRHGSPVGMVEVSDLSIAAVAAEKLSKVFMSNGGKCVVVCEDPLLVDPITEILTTLIPCSSLYEMEDNKVVVTAANDCKGMEFDSVIVLGKKPTTFEQKKALHIACTRALHNLFIISLN